MFIAQHATQMTPSRPKTVESSALFSPPGAPGQRDRVRNSDGFDLAGRPRSFQHDVALSRYLRLRLARFVSFYPHPFLRVGFAIPILPT